MTSTTTGGTRAASRTAWAVVGVLVLAGVVAAFQVGKLVAALPAVSAELGIGLVLRGVVLGGFNLVAALTGAALGMVTGRLGPERAVVLGLLLVAAASTLGALVTTGPLLLLTTVVEGAGFVAVVVAAPSLIIRATRPEDFALALGVWGTYMPAGQAIMLLAAPLLYGALGWRGLWQLNAAIATLCAVLAWRVLGRSHPAEPPGAPDSRLPARLRSQGTDAPCDDLRLSASAGLRHDLAAAVRARGSRLLTLIFAAYALQFIALAGFLPSVYADQGLGSTATAAATSVVVAVNIAGNLTAGVLLRRGAARWALIAVAAAVMGVAALGVFAPGLPFPATYACAIAFSAVGGLLPASVLAGVPVLVSHPRLVPVTNGLIVQGVGLGMVIGPVAAGTLAHLVGGWHATPLIVSTVAACVVLLALRLRLLERPGLPARPALHGRPG